MTNHWSNLVDPTEAEAETLIIGIEQQLGQPLHDVVRRHLYQRRADTAHAFPRLENHFDRYLFGQFQVPTSARDNRSEFLEISFVVTFDSVWSVVAVPTRTELTDRFLERLGRAIEAFEAGATAGDAIGRLMTVVIGELESFLGETGDTLTTVQQLAHDLADSRNLSRAIKEQMPGLHDALADVRSEVASVGTVVDQMETILERVASDAIDLHRIHEGHQTELFGASTEIHLLDTWYRARRVKVLQDEQLEQANLIGARLGAVSEHDELTSGRFIGAIASIMLVPTFLVGLYGMNFDRMPELHWQLGYGSVVVIIVAVTAFQIWLFRRKRWI